MARSRKRPTARAVIMSAACAASVVALAPGTASASEPAGDSGEAREAHCVRNIQTEQTSCFDTLAEANRAAPDWAFRFWGKPKYHGHSITITTGMIGGACPPGLVEVADHSFANLRSIDGARKDNQNWNNRISSLKSRNGCHVRLYAKKNWDGHKTKFLDRNEPRLGRVPDPGKNWNNAATSFTFR